jgi:hypothetical protein
LERVITPDLFIVFALIQSAIFMLLLRFLDLYEREPLSVLAVMAAWGPSGPLFCRTRATKPCEPCCLRR